MSWKSCLVVFTVCILILGADENIPPKFDASAEATATQRQEKIQAEIERLGSHEWAGEYYLGDGTGVNVSLAIAPESGYVFEWHGCLGVYDRNYGAVQYEDGTIRLSFTFENKQEGFQGIAEEFVVVPWAERTYLIPSDDIVGFCNDVNSGSEPRDTLWGFYLLRRGDESKKVSGFPSVPEDYKGYLLERPIEASIARVGPVTTRPSVIEGESFKDTAVTLDVGSSAGALPGMEFHVTKPKRVVQTVTIIKVREDSADGVVTRFGDFDPAPQAGWKVSTRASYH